MRFVLLAALLAATLPAADLYLIRNAVVHTLAGDPIENGSVLIEDGKIIGVGRNLRAPRGAEVIDADGQHLYPGLFDAFSHLGLVEVNSIRGTLDLSEKGDFNPQLEAITAVHPASEHIPVTRANGVTHALTAMQGGVIPSQASLIHLDGWTFEEMAIGVDGPLVMHWPRIRVVENRGRGRGSDDDTPDTFRKAQQQYEEKVAEIEGWLEAARHYAQARKSGQLQEPDAKLEALLPVVEGTRAVLMVADRERTIRNAVAFAEKHKLKMILGGGDEAAQVKDLLKEKGIPVILGPTQTVPGEEDDPYDRIFAQPGELHAAGVRFAFSTMDSSDSRTLPYQAAGAVPFGLPQEEALKAVTVYPAQILGLGDKLGTIEEGKIANLILTDGDPLEIKTEILRLFIEGKPVSTDNKHRSLHEKYLQRLE